MGLQVWLFSQPSSFLHSGAGPVLLLPLLLSLSLPLLLPLLAVVSTLVIDSVVVPVGWGPTVSLSPGVIMVLVPVETGSVLVEPLLPLVVTSLRGGWHAPSASNESKAILRLW
ncbi:MAG: hypothetical protein AAGF11_38705 [Myxococcota bacterium]